MKCKNSKENDRLYSIKNKNDMVVYFEKKAKNKFTEMYNIDGFDQDGFNKNGLIFKVLIRRDLIYMVSMKTRN